MTDVAIEAAPVEASRKRFGMFLGVYTPSILTILGVIMYQRFGWVVGNAGLGGALGIVLLAHVISVTTGLSVASIATNQRVGIGGNYYIISRSLGLSIGGAIGLALYVALALGVSLYLIGFAEAVIAATGWSPMGTYINDIRLVGTIACVVISAVTLVSTSIALKSQLLVLVCIVLSLISIFIGAPAPNVHGATPVVMGAPEGAPSFATVFAVFFPAVTGFTAGVGMSGDLKDPRRAIPIGTMAAIVTGLVIYLVLPVFMANAASAEDLQANNNILLEIARVPWLVTLGVAAATVSSALGSILGAPRTLQALALDGIVPRFLGRGREEPRVALAVTILIAEGGILIGELELVGAIISMFFLTCYGFLCLACGLERWASPDFRPQFKVPIWVSLLGAIACFMVMFQIDPLSMFGSIVIMGLVYAVLKRRQLVLGSGDTWGGVWSAVVRAGLLRLRQTDVVATQRNWRPNMILMTRKSGQRRDMIEFARDVVGDRGILTHFDLQQGTRPRARVDENLEAEYPGMFARVQGCEDPLSAIPDIAANFGFVGLETNVVMVGWPRDAAQKAHYAAMIRRLLDLDLSVLMLRYDASRGFGRRERIDIWWDGVTPTGQLMLTLAHLLLSSPQWKDARVRLLVNGQSGMDEAAANRRLRAVVGQARVKAEPVLLGPLPDDASLPVRIRQESAYADLVMVHALSHDEAFVSANDELVNPLGTALLVRPSSDFADAGVVFEQANTTPSEPPLERGASMPAAPAGGFGVPLPEAEELARPLESLETQVFESLERFERSVQQPSVEEEQAFIEETAREIAAIGQVRRRLHRRGDRRETAQGLVEWAKNRYASATIERVRGFTVARSSRRVEGVETLQFETAWQRRLRDGLNRLRSDLADIVSEVPTSVGVPTSVADWASSPDDPTGLSVHKALVRMTLAVGRAPPERRVPLRAQADRWLGFGLSSDLEAAVRKIGLRRLELLGRTRRLNRDVSRFFARLNVDLDPSGAASYDARQFREFFARELSVLEDAAHNAEHRTVAGGRNTVTAVRTVVSAAFKDLVRTAGDARIAPPRNGDGEGGDKTLRRAAQALGELPALWDQQNTAMGAALRLDVQVEWLRVEARRSVQRLYQRVEREIENGPMAAIDQAMEILNRVRALREEPVVSDDSDSGPSPRGVSDSGSWEPASDQDLRQELLRAADELRATWEEPYRPAPREMVDQLLAGLGRAADRVPVSVTTATEEALSAAEEGDPQRVQVTYPARRLAQNFLEKRVALPARDVLQTLPETVAAAQSALVDAVRLVAFDLEQRAVGAEGDDPTAEAELVESMASEGMLAERVSRLQATRATLVACLTEVRQSLIEEASRALDDVRDAVSHTGAGLVSGGQQRVSLRRAGGNIVSGARSAVSRVTGRVTDSLGRINAARAAAAPSGGTLADDLLELKAQLAPHPETQAALPLVYRRLFGRAALENVDLLVGRQAELEALHRAVGRWKLGAGGPVAIIGEPRSGRSTMANLVAREIVGDRASVRVTPPTGGTSSADELNQAVVRAVGGREGQSAEIALRAMPPGAVLVVDDLGRWIERTPGGLGALRLWHQLWRRLGDRHLFVLTATPFAWAYAGQLLGLSESFLDEIRCGALSRFDLEELILLRQRTSDYALDLVGEQGGRRRARFGWNDAAQLKRLHERSRGNPGDALELWRRSIVGVKERRIEISIGMSPDTGVLDRLPLRWYAALTSIALHRSVTTARMARVMRQTREEAVGQLSDLERASLVYSERNGGWTLDPALQPHILEVLRKRRMLG